MPVHKNYYWDIVKEGDFEGGQFQVIFIKNNKGEISYSISDDGETVTKGIRNKDEAIAYLRYILYDRLDKDNSGEFNISFSDWKIKYFKKDKKNKKIKKLGINKNILEEQEFNEFDSNNDPFETTIKKTTSSNGNSGEIDSFVKEIDSLRKQGKNKWYFFNGVVNLKNVKIKGYNTWLQIFEIDGIDCASPMGLNVKEFKSYLKSLVEDS